MLKHILNLILLLIMVSHISVANAQENPLIYQLFIRENINVDGGQLVIIDPLTFTQINKIILSPSNPARIELTLDKKQAIIINSVFSDPKKGMQIVDLSTKAVKKLFEGIGVYGAKVAPNGMIWALLNETQEVVIINPKDLNIEGRIRLDEAPRDIIFSLDDKDKRAYISLVNSEVFVFDYVTTRSITAIKNLPKGDDSQIRAQELELSADGKILYIGSDTTISIADTSTGTPIRIRDSFSLPRTTFGDFLLKASRDGKFVYIAEYLGSDLYIYNTQTKEIKSIRSPRESGILTSLNLSSDGKILYAGGFYGVAILDTQSNTLITTIQTGIGIGPPNPFSLGATVIGDFSIGKAPTLQATSPSANDNFVAGQEVKIKWTTRVAEQSYSIANHRVDLSTDGGQTFNVITGAEQLPPTAQEFTWTVPNIEVINKAQIRVSTVDLGARRASSTSGNFSIIKMPTGDTQAPSVAFLSPIGSEKFNAGTNLQINWMSSDNVGVTSQDLSLSMDGGNTFPLTIASGLPGATQSFLFPIPSNLETQQAKLRLIVKDAAGNVAQTITLAKFIIEEADTTVPTVTISKPTSNERLIAGQPIQVNWQSTDNKAVVSQALSISFDAGVSFNQLATFGNADNTFVINNIDQLNFTDSEVTVRVIAMDAKGNIGQATTKFAIAPGITNAAYQSKVLTLSGVGFMTNSANSTVSLFVNDKQITLTPKSVSNNSFTIKGNKKKLNIVKGNNSVKLVVDGVSSNTSMFAF